MKMPIRLIKKILPLLPVVKPCKIYWVFWVFQYMKQLAQLVAVAKKKIQRRSIDLQRIKYRLAGMVLNPFLKLIKIFVLCIHVSHQLVRKILVQQFLHSEQDDGALFFFPETRDLPVSLFRHARRLEKRCHAVNSPSPCSPRQI